MKKSRFTDTQIMAALKQGESGVKWGSAALLRHKLMSVTE